MFSHQKYSGTIKIIERCSELGTKVWIPYKLFSVSASSVFKPVAKYHRMLFYHTAAVVLSGVTQDKNFLITGQSTEHSANMPWLWHLTLCLLRMKQSKSIDFSGRVIKKKITYSFRGRLMTWVEWGIMSCFIYWLVKLICFIVQANCFAALIPAEL